MPTPTSANRSECLEEDRVIIENTLHAEHPLLADAFDLGRDAVTYAIGRGLRIASAEFLAKCRQTLRLYQSALIVTDWSNLVIRLT